MFAELDRQLEHVRTQIDAIATRSGFLVATTAVAAAVLAARIQTGKFNVQGALWALGIAGVLGTLTLVPLLGPGPSPGQLMRWANAHDPNARTNAVAELYHAKLMLLEGNRTRLALMTGTFYLQGIAVVVAIILSLVSTLGR
ncbi:hypothetical protein [Krasilnikovia sp. MM14-A1004]|uniref:hypothetical protein n=1 Tax=Krasilnikovia sp. MM14-A1004 TaxID=3373541 RepID=UPI00399C7D31